MFYFPSVIYLYGFYVLVGGFWRFILAQKSWMLCRRLGYQKQNLITDDEINSNKSSSLWEKDETDYTNQTMCGIEKSIRPQLLQ